MTSINDSATAAQVEMPAAATIPLDDTPSPGQQAEVDYLKKELGDLGVVHPELEGLENSEEQIANPFSFYHQQQEQRNASADEDEDEDDGLGLDFIA